MARIGQWLKYIRNYAVVNVNRRLGREYIPHPFRNINIETSGLCNLKCRFCAYEKKTLPRATMTNDFFGRAAAEAAAMGYENLDLTPTTGDIFMDRRILDKMRFLDGLDGIRQYTFFTNFTIPDRAVLERVFSLKKLARVNISLYGHDLESFTAITQSTEKVYHRLAANLESLFELEPPEGCVVEIGWRSYRNAPSGAETGLLPLLRRLREERGIQSRRSRVYNNWGGRISQNDVAGLDIVIQDGEVYKKGACALLFSRLQITANGIVNGCACRDVDATLRIGDLNEAPLREIVSTRNPLYMKLIEDQQRGRFKPVCRSCDFYKSIYRNRRTYKNDPKPPVRLSGFYRLLGANDSGG